MTPYMTPPGILSVELSQLPYVHNKPLILKRIDSERDLFCENVFWIPMDPFFIRLQICFWTGYGFKYG